LLSTQLERILGRYGAIIVERTGTDTEQALANLAPWQDNIFLVPQTITNDVSSTKVRLFLKRGMSVRYLLPATVVEYIESRRLYSDDAGVHAQTPETAVPEKGKPRPLEVPGQPFTYALERRGFRLWIPAGAVVTNQAGPIWVICTTRRTAPFLACGYAITLFYSLLLFPFISHVRTSHHFLFFLCGYKVHIDSRAVVTLFSGYSLAHST
jgi:hypothetical protein